MTPQKRTGGRGRGRKKDEREVRREPAGLVTLEEVLVAFQKSLARSTRSALETSRSEPEFATGKQPLYVVEGLDVDLSTGIQARREEDDGAPEGVLLDFAASEGERSTIHLRVEAKPLELERAARLLLADLDPLRERSPVASLRATALDEEGRPAAGRELAVHVTGEPGSTRLQVTTNERGQVDFTIDPMRRQLTWRQGRARFDLDLVGHAYFVWCSSEHPELESEVVRLPATRS